MFIFLFFVIFMIVIVISIISVSIVVIAVIFIVGRTRMIAIPVVIFHRAAAWASTAGFNSSNLATLTVRMGLVLDRFEKRYSLIDIISKYVCIYYKII